MRHFFSVLSIRKCSSRRKCGQGWGEKEKKAKSKARGVIGSSRRGCVIHLLFSSWDGEPSLVPNCLFFNK